MRIKNYDDVKRCLVNRLVYRHSSSYAERVDSQCIYDEYRVYSYSTLVLVYSLLEQRVISFNDDYYSKTTSRLQNMIRVAFNIESVVTK